MASPPSGPSRASAEPNVVVRTIDGRRIVSRTNPEISYAYGAPAVSTGGRRRTSSNRSNGALDTEDLQDTSAPLEDALPDARSRYQALRQRQQQSRGSPTKQPNIPPSRTQDLAAIYEDRNADDDVRSTGSRSRHSAQSAGRSRGTLQGHFNSFYMDRNMEDPLDEASAEDQVNSLPSSLLLGAQRPSHNLLSNTLPGINSIHSSDAGVDSRSHDYTEEARQAGILAHEENAGSNSLLASLSPSTWFPSRRNPKESNGAPESKEQVGSEYLLPGRRRRPRVSQDNQAYQPDHVELSESDMSGEDTKHSRRGGRKSDSKSTGRGGRDDNKIWMTGRRRRGKGKGALEYGDDPIHSDDEVEMLQDVESSPQIQQGVHRAGFKSTKEAQLPSSSQKSHTFWMPDKWTIIIMAALAIFVRLYTSTQGLDLSNLPSGMAPRTKPTSLADASGRIVQLETAFEALRVAYLSASKEDALLASKVGLVEKRMDKLNDMFTSSQANMESRLSRVDRESQRIQRALDEVRDRLSVLVKKDSASQDERKSLEKRISLLETHLQQTDKQVAQAKAAAARAEKVADNVKQSLRKVQDKLPAEIAVATDRHGTPVVDAEMLRELKRVFAEKQDVSWETFARTNDHALRTMVQTFLASEIEMGTVVSQARFIELLHLELDKAKSSMEARFNENTQEMQNEILAKVRSQQEMFERSGSWGRSANTPNKEIGADGHEAVLALIDEALEVYSADRIAKRDFALYTAGARIIPSYTSPTFHQPDIGGTSWLHRVVGRKPSLQRHSRQGQPPVVALYPDNSPGMCWAFAGDDGQLGISLARRVVVSDVTLEHTPASISLEAGTSAPRDVTVWGIVERSSDVRRLIAYRQHQQPYEASPMPIPPSERHLLLATFTYDALSANARSVQTFPASHEARALQIPMAAVQVRIHSNHGNRDFTCLYRVRIHGQEWTTEDEANTNV